MFARIISTKLNKPPREADLLASNGNLLVVWRRRGFVIGENGAKCHFAMHSPDGRWQGYRWNKKYGNPTKILPVTHNIVWVETDEDYIMRLEIAKSCNADVEARAQVYEFYNLLDASESGFLINGWSGIDHLRFDEEQLSEDNLYPDVEANYARFLSDGATEDNLYPDVEANYARFLSDGAIAILVLSLKRLFVLSPEGNRLHEEETSDYVEYYHCDSFIAARDSNNDLYYTDDPRKGWAKSYALKVHSRLHGAGTDVYPFFITIRGSECYIVLREWNGVNGCYHAYLYRSPLESPEHIKCVWEIARSDSFTYYNGLICATSLQRIYGIDDTFVPANDGFLAWDPITNTFHADIPRSPTNIQKISSGRIPPISIPEIWGRNAPQR